MFTHKIDDQTELRLIEMQNADELNQVVTQSYEHLIRWEGWLKPDHTLEDTKKFIKRNLLQFAENGGFEILIWHKGKVAGQIGYNYFDWINRKTEIGYWLGESFQRKGLVTRACRALIEHAFGDLKLNRVEIRCGFHNIRSRAVPERLGFKQEGVLREAEWLHTDFVDLVVYGMLASEWTTRYDKE